MYWCVSMQICCFYILHDAVKVALLHRIYFVSLKGAMAFHHLLSLIQYQLCDQSVHGSIQCDHSMNFDGAVYLLHPFDNPQLHHEQLEFSQFPSFLANKRK
eukprot:TRINITY_DN7778_c0_g1_i1.p2 TRINITY_DN7778_c0_g1~~TRINITY_DN7778_c0_g1_i1.p2  ORF type:complete len:101 (+),score=5.91 TRINITY_DN7778_c0_g1_i1:730-1032(+)